MSILADVAFLIVLMVVVEKAAVFHVRLYVFTAVGDSFKWRDPPMFRPYWRVLLYSVYLIGGLASLQGFIQNILGYIFIIAPIFAIVLVDIAALRKQSKETHGRDDS
jgi:hypothetical protein